ncbi:hypothetical protein L596_010211 [Steinernema carpocapsae]|uniref:Uncharacterized protein n=1 Tax=Steinernema carpocapsae TaxID=34508 RepID=A0A4U5PHY2_STECR|nr:hypothetical protein L596_010211 [Steinernema carpocapsae]
MKHLLLCTLLAALFVDILGAAKKSKREEPPIEISISEHYILKFTLKRDCANMWGTEQAPSCEDRIGDGKLQHHNKSLFNMRLLNVGVGDKIIDVSPTMEFVRHKSRFPKPGCSVDYEFINDKPICHRKPKGGKNICRQISHLAFELLKDNPTRFLYDSIEIYTPTSRDFFPSRSQIRDRRQGLQMYRLRLRTLYGRLQRRRGRNQRCAHLRHQWTQGQIHLPEQERSPGGSQGGRDA